ncbi:T9SS type A sorting domain-containing protein, partial [Algibacter sp.]|uniref:T9SS type A sorting domain-containing protein n=1 Tax=Algibacter sp. TaxID=1872428 RepID=UPI003C714161
VQSLGVDVSDEDAQFATFITKSNLKDITDPLNTISLGGNLILKVDMTDRGEPGEFDSIAFNLIKDGNLLYSSNWTGIATDELQLTGGNLKVHSGFSLGDSTSKALEPIVEELFDSLELVSWPNPSDDYFNIKLKSKNTVEIIYIHVFDLNGRLISFKTGVPNREYKIGASLQAGLYFINVIQGNTSKQVKLIKY